MNSIFSSIVVMLFSSYLVSAQWSSNPAVNNAIVTATGDQNYHAIVSDGSGGAIVTWRDNRNGADYDIYAQRIDAEGVLQWATDGVIICSASNNQSSPSIVSNGTGGAIISWTDYRSGTSNDIYAQCINAVGLVQWPNDGVAICTFSNDQDFSTLISDGSGGAIIAWQDNVSATMIDIYVQRINASGLVQWATDGVGIAAFSNDQSNPKLVSDGSGGAIVVWEDSRNGVDIGIYSQRINAAGQFQWNIDGVPICTLVDDQKFTAVVSDGSGGAIITWQYYILNNYYILAQRINESGAVQWTVNGIIICESSNYLSAPSIVPFGLGGAIITWEDNRSGIDTDIYAQRVNSGGTVLWAINGVDVCSSIDEQRYPTLVPDGLGGIIVTWVDNRNAIPDIYAQRISATGVPQWDANGILISSAIDVQNFPKLVSDGMGGAVISWEDRRSGSNLDIYAQNINAGGTIGLIVGTDNKEVGSVFKIFPNPFSLSTLLQLNEDFNDATLIIQNIHGQKIKELSKLSGNTITIYRENLEEGVFFIQLIEQDKILMVNKLVITN